MMTRYVNLRMAVIECCLSLVIGTVPRIRMAQYIAVLVSVLGMRQFAIQITHVCSNWEDDCTQHGIHRSHISYLCSTFCRSM